MAPAPVINPLFRGFEHFQQHRHCYLAESGDWWAAHDSIDHRIIVGCDRVTYHMRPATNIFSHRAPLPCLLSLQGVYNLRWGPGEDLCREFSTTVVNPPLVNAPNRSSRKRLRPVLSPTERRRNASDVNGGFPRACITPELLPITQSRLQSTIYWRLHNAMSQCFVKVGEVGAMVR